MRTSTAHRRHDRQTGPARRRRRPLVAQVERLEERTLLATIFVDDSNLLGPGTGTAVDPFVSIQSGINLAVAGDDVQVAQGVYAENIVMKTGVDVRGAGADQTTIRGVASVDGVVLFDDVTDAAISGFLLTVDTPVAGVDRAVVFQGASDATAVLEFCVITDTQYGIFTDVPATIRNNTLVSNLDEQGIYVGNAPTDATIVNNIIVGYSVAGIHVVAGFTPPNPIIKYNDVFNNGMNYLNFADQTGINGNISADPLFVGAPDFHLQAGSPAIDVGDPASPPDSDGTPADMGAFPFAPTVTFTMPADRLFVGEFAKVPVSIAAASGLTMDDLKFNVLEGPPGGEVSLSRDVNFNPAAPDIMLLAGFQDGVYHLQAIHTATGNVVGTGEFSVTSLLDSNEDSGPGLWVDGEVPADQFVSGAAWGGGPAGPQNVNVVPANGTRRVAILFVDTSTQRYTNDAATLNGFRTRWDNEADAGVVMGGKTFSMAHFFRETSYNNFSLTADVFGPVNLPGNWGNYFVLSNGVYAPTDQLAQAAITAGDTLINYNNYDSVVFVSQEVTGPPAMSAWPFAWGGTFTTAEGNRNLGVISMPNIWGVGNNRHIHETLSHEMGHNIGLPDLYTPSVPMPNPSAPGQLRNVGVWDMMDTDDALPHFSVAHRMMLGWVQPGWIQTFNFASAGGPVDQTVTLSPIENGAPAPGRFVGLEIRIADGLNYYCEYRKSQAAQIGDQIANPNHVVCTDVASPPYVAPIARPSILLVPNDTDMDGSVLGNGGDFEQTDFSTPGFPVEFKLDVSGIDGNKADVRVRYGVNSRPDPSIRPWPASADRQWQSPDIEVRNARSMANPAMWFNVPWVGNPNTVVAKIKNNGNIGAPGVRADFFVKDYTVGGAPETFIGSSTQNIGAGATVEFTAPWTPPAMGHFCIIVRIPLYQVPPMTGILELSGTNNEAQSNYDRFISATASPASREISSMTVGNPFPERTSILLTVSQTNPAYRTYLGNRWVTLDPGETAQIPLMFEFAGDDFVASLASTGSPGGNFTPTANVPVVFKRVPNDVQIVGLIRDPRGDDSHVWTPFDGAQAQIVTGRAAEFEDFRQDAQRTVTGRVVTKDNGSAVPGGKVLVRLTSESGQGVRYVEAAVAPSGLFQAVVPGGWKKGVAFYLGTNGFGEATSHEIENKELQEFESPFVIAGPNSVPFQLFSVITDGTIETQVRWDGADPLKVSLIGRRPGENDVAMPFAEAVGTSPLVISYDVTPDDVARGVNWRLAVMDPSGGGATGVQGTIHITTPADSMLQPKFEHERVQLRSGDFWPSAALTTQFVADLASTTSGGLHGLISLNRACTCYDAMALQGRGVERQSFLPDNNAFGLIRRGANLADTFLQSAIRALTRLEPEDKIDPNILLGNFDPFTVIEDTASLPIFRNFVLNADGTLDLAVLFAQDTPLKQILETLREQTNEFVPITDLLWQVNIAPDRLIPLASLDAVEWVDPGLNPGSPDNNQTRATLNVNPVHNATTNAGPPPTINYAGLSGNGITIGIQDTGIGAHVDLNVVGSINPNPVGTHGSHVAGIAAGSGLQSSQNDANGNPNGGPLFQFRGMAPQAAILSGGDLFTAGSMLNAIQNFSLDVTNRSQSFSFDGQYGAQDQTIDQFIRGGATSGGNAIARRPWVISAGNHGFFPGNQRPAGPFPPGNVPIAGGQIGYYSLTKQLKNAIIVGNWNFGQLNQSSSLGPAYDGRIKPDVVAPGTAVISTGIGAGAVSCPLGVGNDYISCGGTSMSSPAVAGILGLLLQGWQNTYNQSRGLTIDANPPLPSTLRAVVIQTATDIVNNNVRGGASADVDADSNAANNGGVADGLGNPTATAGPDYTTGWGLVNAQAAATLLQNSRMEAGVPVPNQIIQDAVWQAGILNYDFVVDQAFVNAGQPLRITMAWDDREAALQAVATNPTLVNDLDLELIAPDGTIFYPWQLGHTINDAMGNPLANNAQPPGTAIQIARAITPINNPTYTFNCPGPGNCGGNQLQAGFPGNIDYVPQNALQAGGAWVATQGKDHLNNVEQVQVNVPQLQVGHWKARVIGFNVQAGVTQDFSLVGMPRPALADLVAFSTQAQKVGLPGFAQNITFNWTARNDGQAASVATDFQVLLSTNFTADAGDVVLLSSAADSVGALAVGATANFTTTVQITQSQADQLLGVPAGTATINDLINNDVFLLVRVDPFNNINNPAENVVLEHNETNVGFVQLGRLVDVVIVADRSGSMGANIPISNGTRTKLQLLQDSANLFLDLMRKDFGDRVGIVSFETGVTTEFVAPPPGIGTITAYTAGNTAAAKNEINTLATGNLTNIRDALQRGLDLLTAQDGTARRRVLIFFSDGMATAGGDPTEAAFLQQFAANNVTVFSVGFGTQGGGGLSGIDIPLLQTLATSGPAGFYQVTLSDLDVDKFFVNAVAGAVDTSIIVDPIATIGGGQTQTVPVSVGQQDGVVQFVLTWDNPANNLDLSVRGPSGQVINAGNFALFGGRVTRTAPVGAPYEILTVSLPIAAGSNVDHGGGWQMIITNTSGSAVRYSASALGQSTVRLEMTQPQGAGVGGSFLPGEPIPLEVFLHEDDQVPITSAVVRVTPTVPANDVGAILAAGLVNGGDLAEIPLLINNEPLPVRDRILTALHRKHPGLDLTRPIELPSFDLVAGGEPGQFVGSFARTRLAGAYQFLVRVSGLARDCQPFDREIMHTVNVSDRVDPNRTPVDVTKGPGTVNVTVTPGTIGGSFVGAGLVGQISITGTGTGVSASGGILDNLNGSYTQTFTTLNTELLQLDITGGGVNFGPMTVDLRVPAPASVDPPGAPNDVATKITVTVAAGASLAGVTGVSLVGSSGEVALGGVMVNAAARTVMAQVPPGLEPGPHLVRLESAAGHGPTSDVFFQVIGVGQNVPGALGMVSDGLDNALGGASDLEQKVQKVQTGLRDILIGMRSLRLGGFLSPETRGAAFAEVVGLLAEGDETLDSSDLPATMAALDHALLDSRVLRTPPIQTPVGSNIHVPLGNDVAVMFGRITNPGQTQVMLTPGPREFPPAFRGRTYVTYDVTTTATFDPTQLIDLEFGYQDGDFDDESALRVYHRENGRWVDRTAGVDPDNNMIMARVGGLSDFVILEPAVEQTGAITGEAFDDQSGDGTRQAAEPGLPDWTIFLDTNGDGVLNNPVSGDGVCDENASELCTETDAAGNYAFSALSLGSYTVQQVPQAGWTAIAPGAAGHAVELTAQAAVATGIDFANADQTAPTLVGVPTDQTVETALSSGRVVTYTAPTATDAVDPAPTVNCTPASGGNFAVGTTQVTCTATDAAGNSASASFNVIVNDTGGPTVVTANRVVANKTITEIVLTFNESLAPATAVNPANYALVSAAGADKVFGTADDTPLALQAPVYDNATRTVRLFPVVPPKSTQFLRLTVNGTSSVTDPSGNRLDGDADGTPGGNFVILFGPKIGYIDSNGDAVSIAIKTGSLSLTLEPDGDGRDLTIFEADPAKSILTGTVKKSKGSTTADGVTNLRSITGLGQLRLNSLPASFVVANPDVLAIVVDQLLESDDLDELATRPHRFRLGGRR